MRTVISTCDRTAKKVFVYAFSDQMKKQKTECYGATKIKLIKQIYSNKETTIV